METIDFEDNYEVLWDGCDLVVETLLAFYIEPTERDEGDPNFRSLELVIEDRLCEDREGFARFSAVNYRFSATMLLDYEEDALLRNGVSRGV